MTAAAIAQRTTGPAAVPTALFIDGQWRPAASGRTFEVVDPCTEGLLAVVADADLDDAEDALEAATRAQQSWGRSAPRARSSLLHTAHALLTECAEHFAEIICAETGKPRSEARGEVAYGAGFLRWFAEQAAHARGGYGPSPAADARLLSTRVPVGPVC